MRLVETRDLFIREFEFPVDRGTVIETAGDVDLDAPGGEAESIGEVLERCEEPVFGSADELFDALVAHVGDAYVGRKYYDDRGSVAHDVDQVSF